MSSSLIETIKARVDLVEEVGLVVALQKAGKAFKGTCPFHNERTPSFYVFVETQTWRCFGCHEGGDIFTFVEKQQGVEFWDALLYLAEKAGIEVNEHSDRDPEEERETRARKERLRSLNEDALLWFHQSLLRSREAVEARAYVKERGINSESVLSFGLGYAPDRRDALSSYLLGKGYTEEELVTGGLAREREADEARTGGIYDYFRNRLIFPIRDTRGRVIGFGGRALGDGQPKYLNSPQTLLFEKNSVLYALDQAREAIKQEGQVVIVEGYVDAIIAHQYGTKQTVACIGSAITEKHIQQLKKLTRQVTLALDPDTAGEAATEHGIQEALKGFDRTVVPVPLPAEGGAKTSTFRGGRRREPRWIIRLEERVDAEINVLQLPAGEDPDEVIQRDFATWEHAVRHPLPLIDYYFAARTAGLNLREAAGQAEAARRLLPVIATISDRAKRDAYLRQLAGMLHMDERSLGEELQRVQRGQRANGVIADFSGRRGGPIVSIGQNGQAGQRVSAGEADENVDPKNSARGASEQQREGREEREPGLDRTGRGRLKWEDYLLGLLLLNPTLREHVCGIINDGDFAGTDTRELYRIFNSLYQRGSSPLPQPWETVVPAALQETVGRVRKCVETRSSADIRSLAREARQCAFRLKRSRLLQSDLELRFLIREAKEAGDAAAERLLWHQVVMTTRELRTIDSAMPLRG